MDRGVTCHMQRHAFFAARNQDRFAVDDPPKLGGGLGDLRFGRNRPMHGDTQFLPVRRDQRRPAVDAVIVAFRINYNGFVELPCALDNRANDPRRQPTSGPVL